MGSRGRQTDLPFYPHYDGTPPHQRHSETSLEAAEGARKRINRLQQEVLGFVAAAGPEGATDDEMQIGLRMNPSTQRPRRVELVQKGFIMDSERRRPTRTGRRAVVWITAGASSP
jgi:hypothetical protein